MTGIFSNRAFLLLSILALALSAASRAAETKEEPVTLKRRFAAIPWLAEVPETPFVVIRYGDIPAVADIPRTTECYDIDPDVVLSGYSYFFFVRGLDRDFLVGSIPGLAILCRELAAIEELKNTHKGKEFASGIGEAVMGIGSGLGNLIMHPGQSFADFGHRIRVSGRSLERALEGDGIGSDQRGVERSLLGEGPAGKQRRLLAAELGVDVYTDNPLLREQLIGHSRTKFTGVAASWAIPAWASVFSRFNLLSGDDDVEKLIVEYDPAELRRQAGVWLSPVFGQDREDASSPLGRLLANPNFTPRQIAYIGRDLSTLSSADNLGLALEKLAEADMPERADMLTMEIRMHALFHSRVAPIRAFVPFMNLFAVLDAEGGFHFLFAGDSIRPADHNRPILSALIRRAMDEKARSLTLWVLGDVSPESMKAARGHNIAVEQNLLLRLRERN